MKKSERRMILILVIITIVVIAILVKVRNGKNSAEVENGNSDNNQTAVSGEFFETLEDGTKKNTSNKLAEVKKFENYEISNIQLTEKNGDTLLLADVKNMGEARAEDTLIQITLLDKEGKELVTYDGIISAVDPQGTVPLSAAIAMDFANTYDVLIKRAEIVPEVVEQ